MRHLVKGRTLGREKAQREALIHGLIANLVLSEKIVTTEAKAKEIKPVMDKIITKIKKAKDDKQKKISVVRDLRKDLNVDCVTKLSGDFFKKFDGRNSGYTRIIKLTDRKSDSAKMAVIEFV
ncbi:MAG: 50S ribosomal protein L17 [Candidatus Moranbacteria bacterium GW2011_GWE1_35_17]|nr:MAG: 50S ribosomal protein L17 [Candidatus Moranbacteria bacterium GW2011_GWE1_35_17]KKP68733.1 MAG: 50S ribosomal protein L17 [Candidatus Moranbacteria bacterium GW2011_GWE2_35_164]KKP84429.1 MAG: 50S ribosomal protein L17 [Candidatus Moranbacteria bacterium GW2011_GWF2_35_54]